MHTLHATVSDLFRWLDHPLALHFDLFGFDLAIREVAGLLEWVGLLVSFAYLILEFRQKNAMWVLSILTSLTYICIYIHAKLYADMSFSLFNIGMSVWGLTQWRKRSAKQHTACDPINKKKPDDAGLTKEDLNKNLSDTERIKKETKAKPGIEYRTFSRREWWQVLGVTVAVYGLIYLLLCTLTDSPVPARDAFNTTINIVGTWVLGRKVIEVWGFWLVANAFSVYLYCLRGLYPTMGLYLFYTAASIYGFVKWRRQGVRIR